MNFLWRIFWLVALSLTVLPLLEREASAQSFGIELHNTLMPASGAMGGVSIAQPQDLPSALAGNPASLAQFEGTHFTFGGAWTEPTYNLAHTGGVLPNIGAFEGKSESEGSALGNIAVSQDVSALGLPATFAMGLTSAAGAGVNWRDIPESNGTTVVLQLLQIGAGLGVDLTDRLSAGGAIMLGSATLDAPFTGIGAAAYAYQLRGSVGLNYELNPCTTLGFFYQTRQNFNFDNAIQLELFNGNFTAVQDINAGLPDNLGLGIANDALLDGRLLLAADVLFKQWDNADLFEAIYDNQWVFQLGGQYAYNSRVRLRAGYVYAENPLSPNPGNSAGGVSAGALAALQYLQGTVAVANHHRLTFGVGLRDVLPGIDVDLFGGGMFENSEQLGAFTRTSVEGYWVGTGLTWRFGRGACRRLPVPDDWCVSCE